VLRLSSPRRRRQWITITRVTLRAGIYHEEVNGSDGSAGLIPGLGRMLGNRPYDIPRDSAVIPSVSEGPSVRNW